jgi:isoleucyl-tRNA synthetase
LAYAKVRCGDDIYWLARGTLELSRLEEAYAGGKGVARGTWVEGVPKLRSPADYFRDRGGFEIETVVAGTELIGLEYDGPFDDLPAQAVPGGTPFADEKLAAKGATGITCHRAIAWDGVSDTDGTGIVHTAPGCGKEDRELGLEHGLVSIAPLDEMGKYITGFGELEGRSVLDEGTTDLLIEHLERNGHLLEVEQYPHSYPHCWRCSTELLFRQVDEWYIDMSWRDEIKELVDQIHWIPGYGRERELEWLDNMRDWMISKKRYWGLALPIWHCDACGWFHVIGGRDELRERAIEGLDAFDGNSPHRPWVDAVKIKCEKCGATVSRIEDVGNPWLDAGIVPYSTVRYGSDREYWRQWVPADLVLESFPGQFRNWFYALLAMSAMMERIPPFKTLVGYALVRDEKGAEMHKSLGNAIWFDEAAEKMGVDVMRWIFCGHNVTSNLNFGYAIGDRVKRRVFNTLWNVYAFLCNYARLDGFDAESERVPVAERPDIDRWLVSNLQILVRDARRHYESYDAAAVVRGAEKFIDDLSNWYVRRNRRRFWRGGGTSDRDKLAAYQTLYDALLTLLRIVAPVVPFVTEHMYRALTPADESRHPTSIHLTPFPEVDEAALDADLSFAMDQVVHVVSSALPPPKNPDIRVRQPLSRLIVAPADATTRSAIQRFEDVIAAEINVKAIELRDSAERLVRHEAKPDFGKLGKRFGKNTQAVAEAIRAVDPKVLRAAQREDRAVTVVVNGEQEEIQGDEFSLVEVVPEGLAVSETAAGTLAIDLVLTDALRIEGLARDVVRHVQQLRKEKDLEMEDRIVLRYEVEGEQLSLAFEEWNAYIRAETLATEMAASAGLFGGSAKQIKLGTHRLAIDLERA